jgi:hypothetical protein
MKELPFDPYDFFGYLASGLVFIVTAQLTVGFPKVIGAELKPFDMAVTILATYVAGQIIAGPSKLFYEDILVHKVLGSPTRNLLREHGHPRFRKVFHGFYKPLPAVIRTKIHGKIEAMGVDAADSEGIFLSIRYAPEVISSEQLIGKIDSFRNMYGFNRNVSFSLIASGLCLALTGIVEGNRTLIHFSIPALISGALLLYRFLKFYRQYSYELFNSYAVMAEKGSPGC